MNMQNVTIFEEGTGVHIVIPNTTAKEITNMMAALLINAVQKTSEPAVSEIPSAVSRIPEDIIPTTQDEIKEKEILAEKVRESELNSQEFKESELPWNNDEVTADPVPEYTESDIKENIKVSSQESVDISSGPEETAAENNKNTTENIPESNEEPTEDVIQEAFETTSEVTINNVSEAAVIENNEKSVETPEQEDETSEVSDNNIEDNHDIIPDDPVDYIEESPEMPSDIAAEEPDAAMENPSQKSEYEETQTPENEHIDSNIFKFKLLEGKDIDTAVTGVKNVFKAAGIAPEIKVLSNSIEITTTGLSESELQIVHRAVMLTRAFK